MTIEKNNRGCISGVLCDRYSESTQNRRIVHIDFYNIFGLGLCRFWVVLQYLVYKDVRFKNNANMIEIPNAVVFAEACFFAEIDLHYPNENESKEKP